MDSWLACNQSRKTALLPYRTTARRSTYTRHHKTDHMSSREPRSHRQDTHQSSHDQAQQFPNTAMDHKEPTPKALLPHTSVDHPTAYTLRRTPSCMMHRATDCRRSHSHPRTHARQPQHPCSQAVWRTSHQCSHPRKHTQDPRRSSHAPHNHHCLQRTPPCTLHPTCCRSLSLRLTPRTRPRSRSAPQTP